MCFSLVVPQLPFTSVSVRGVCHLCVILLSVGLYKALCIPCISLLVTFVVSSSSSTELVYLLLIDRFRHPHCDTTCVTDSLIRQQSESTLVSEGRRLDSVLRVPE